MILAVKGNREVKITEVEVESFKSSGYEILEAVDGKIKSYRQKAAKAGK